MVESNAFVIFILCNISSNNTGWTVTFTAWNLSKYGDFSGLYFPILGLNTEIYGVNNCLVYWDLISVVKFESNVTLKF